jgi:deoxyribonuclease-4
MPRLGVHTSIAGGLTNGLADAVRLGCQCMQMFVRNQRQWRTGPLSPEQLAEWTVARAAPAAASIAPIVVHDSYLINLACPDPIIARRSYESFCDELDRCEQLGVDYLVTHPGSHLRASPAEGIARLAEALNRLAADRPAAKTVVLLETTAGQGTNLGWRFEQLAEVLGKVDTFILPPPPGASKGRGEGISKTHLRVGVCLDSCHVFAAGYDLRTPDTLTRTLDEFDAIIGLDRLKAIHINDSRRELGSRVDRHEHIGQGCIGDGGFWSLLHEPRLAEMPMILETPKGTDEETGKDFDALNLARLRRLAKLKRCPPPKRDSAVGGPILFNPSGE